MKNRVFALIMALTVFVLSACSNRQNPDTTPPSASTTVPTNPLPTENLSNSSNLTEPFSDLRGNMHGDGEKRLAAGQFNPNDIITFTFNEGTVFEGSEGMQKLVMENGKNPGLRVRALHADGTTGEGVSVAIIDQNLVSEPSHPEFADKLAAVWVHPDMGKVEFASMHGPAVASLLVGDSIGTAPGAKLYYAAVPAWNGDSKCFADALNWIMATNQTLPNNEKIKIVSISHAPSGESSDAEKNQELYDEAVARAQEQGILVLDGRVDAKTGIAAPAFYDPNDPESVEKMSAGYTDEPLEEAYDSDYPVIGVPVDYRTTAEEYESGKASYQYDGTGGISWGIPYAAGVLAMGWQVNPTLSGEEMVALLIQTAYKGEYGNLFIDPPTFVEAVSDTVK